MSYDNWKTTNPEDMLYCGCGLSAADCVKGGMAVCPLVVMQSLPMLTEDEKAELEAAGLLPTSH